MYKRRFKGFLRLGQNPACSGANANKTRQALANLDWMVNVNLFDNETASFWKGPGMDPKKIKTEVFFLPCAAFLEKEGSHQQQRPLDAVALQGPGSAGRGQARRRHHATSCSMKSGSSTRRTRRQVSPIPS